MLADIIVVLSKVLIRGDCSVFKWRLVTLL